MAEATGKSGSLITARMAADRNRLIFAIPGSPGEARSEGPNSLLRRGALWAENAADILNVLNSKIRPEPLRPTDGGECDLFTKTLDNLQKTADIPPVKNCDKNSILAYLSAEGTDTDEIIRSSGLDAPSVAMLLIELEMEDKNHLPARQQMPDRQKHESKKMKLVIVESPAKAKTINKYLGSDYKVLASFGHIRDLPSKDGSVQPDHDFAMSWELESGRQKTLKRHHRGG